jgi:uncharacterized membrane protein
MNKRGSLLFSYIVGAAISVEAFIITHTCAMHTLSFLAYYCFNVSPIKSCNWIKLTSSASYFQLHEHLASSVAFTVNLSSAPHHIGSRQYLDQQGSAPTHYFMRMAWLH